MKLLVSKIFWLNIIGFAIQLIQVISGVYPLDPKIVGIIQAVLTIILRQLQGTEFNIAGKKIKL
jgi:hypothetical protein